jgi:hypothetical protein
MLLAQQVVPIGERLVALGRDFTDDTNETYLIAHKALRTLLRNNALLSEVELADLREAVSIAAQALGINKHSRGKSISLPGSSAQGLVSLTPPRSAPMS